MYGIDYLKYLLKISVYIYTYIYAHNKVKSTVHCMKILKYYLKICFQEKYYKHKNDKSKFSIFLNMNSCCSMFHQLSTE